MNIFKSVWIGLEIMQFLWIIAILLICFIFNSFLSSFILKVYTLFNTIFFNINFIFFLIFIWVTGILTILYAFESLKLTRKFFVFSIQIFLFTIFMTLLILTDSILLFFLAWEGIGVCSYFLIGFWGAKTSTKLGATKAVVLNRFGDISLFISIIFLTYFLKIFNFSQVGQICGYNDTQIKIIVYLILFASFCKSAQFPLTTWLVTAMEGPTSVSALMHAATLVTAGCILLLKLNVLIVPYKTIFFISCLFTAIYCSIKATIESDFKKIVALSTAAQMSVIFLLIALNKPLLAIMYLTVHSIFKALLFWSIGTYSHHNQNLIKYYMPTKFVFYGILISITALSGLPLFAVYFFKEMLVILPGHNLLYITIFIILIFYVELQSTFYSIRVLKHTLKFYMERPSLRPAVHRTTAVPILLYSCFSVVIGRFLNPKLNSHLTNFYTGGDGYLINFIFIFLTLLSISSLFILVSWEFLIISIISIFFISWFVVLIFIPTKVYFILTQLFRLLLKVYLKLQNPLTVKIYKSLKSKISYLWSGHWITNLEDEELYAITIFIIYYTLLIGFLVPFIPFSLGRLIVGIMGTIGIMYITIEFDNFKNEYIILIFLLFPIILFTVVFIFTCGYWYFASWNLVLLFIG